MFYTRSEIRHSFFAPPPDGRIWFQQLARKPKTWGSLQGPTPHSKGGGSGGRRQFLFMWSSPRKGVNRTAVVLIMLVARCRGLKFSHTWKLLSVKYPGSVLSFQNYCFCVCLFICVWQRFDLFPGRYWLCYYSPLTFLKNYLKLLKNKMNIISPWIANFLLPIFFTCFDQVRRYRQVQVGIEFDHIAKQISQSQSVKLDI